MIRLASVLKCRFLNLVADGSHAVKLNQLSDYAHKAIEHSLRPRELRDITEHREQITAIIAGDVGRYAETLNIRLENLTITEIGLTNEMKYHPAVQKLVSEVSERRAVLNAERGKERIVPDHHDARVSADDAM